MEAYPGQTRLYVVISAMLGLMIGVFMHAFLFDDAGARLAWLVVFASIGGLIGKLLVVAQAPDRPPADPTADEPGTTDSPDDSATQRFFKLQSGIFSDEQLRQLRVRSVTMPMSPPDAEVPLQVRDYDHYARAAVLPGVLEKLTVQELHDRVLTEVRARAPKVPGELDVCVVSFHSEGPLAPDGRCPLGWSFYFVDGRHGLGCAATATAEEIALQFHTAATYSVAEEWEWIDMEDLLKWVETSLPKWGELPIRVRVNLPDDYLAFVNAPLRIADVDTAKGEVLNVPFLERETPYAPGELFFLADILAWFRAEPLGERSDDFAAAIADQDFADRLRTLDPSAINRAASALDRASGPGVVSAVVEAVRRGKDANERAELLHILSRLPSGLATVALHRLAVESSDDVEVCRIAQQLHLARRTHEIDVPRHPLDPLSFLDARRLMGRGNLAVVPLAPSYDPEAELLPVLVDLGFDLRRRRLLSGDANLLVGAQLRSQDGQTEMLLTSTPLPVPCHVLHVLGSNADQVADQVERSEIVYPRSAIIADVHSRNPARVHRAALYVAALRIDEVDLTEHLIAGAERGRSNPALRRAVITALAVQSAPSAREHLDAIVASGDSDDAALIASLLDSPRLTGSVPSV